MKYKLFSIAALAHGIVAILLTGFEPSATLLKFELIFFTFAGLLVGLGAVDPPRWLASKAMRGTICVYLGIACIFINPAFIVSACFIGAGLRLLMDEMAPDVIRVTVRHIPDSLATRPASHVATRD